MITSGFCPVIRTYCVKLDLTCYVYVSYLWGRLFPIPSHPPPPRLFLPSPDECLPLLSLSHPLSYVSMVSLSLQSMLEPWRHKSCLCGLDDGAEVNRDQSKPDTG
jgi:hypothetical protein